jgi:TetR/AcrR family transcriptional repressor of lmrAB and yxaGH operons
MPTKRPSAEATRTKLLDATEHLLSMHGSHGCGLNEVCSVSGVAYGSLYHAFPGGKAELVAASITRSGTAIGDLLEALLADLPFPDAVRTMFETAATTLQATDFTRGCPVGTPAAGNSDETVRADAARAFAAWSAIVADAARRAGHDAEAADRLGQALVALYEGAMLTARAARSVEPVRAAATVAAGLAEPPGPERGRDRS